MRISSAVACAAALLVSIVFRAPGCASGKENGTETSDAVDRMKITISTVTIGLHDPDYEGPRVTKAERLRNAGRLLDVAGERGSDIVCLPETFSTKSTASSHEAENIPDGDTSKLLSRAAKKWRMYIVGPIREKRDGVIRNAAAIFDRQGKHVGNYYKVHAGGTDEPGDSFPVFETDFGKIGVMICYDIQFPESARCLALGGAEIIFWPTMYSGPKEAVTYRLVRARAIENNVFLVPSNYSQPCADPAGIHIGFSAVIDRSGEVLADTGRREGVATATVNLDERRPGVAGNDWIRQRRVNAYRPIVEE